MKKLLLVLVALVVAAGLIMAGCKEETATTTKTTTTTKTSTTSTTTQTTLTTTVKSKYGGTFRISFDSSPGVIGWPAEIMGDGSCPTQVFYDTFLRFNSKYELVPWLAETYKVADDLKSITFNLRKDVKFHDGTDFNATAAKWNLDNQIAAKKASNWASVEVINDYAIQVNLKVWRNSCLSDFATESPSWMVSPTAFEKNGIDWMRQNPVSTGPFKFVSFSKDVGMKTVRNPDYWAKDEQGNQLPYLDALEYVFIADPMTQLAEMKTGDIDMTSTETGKRAADLEAAGVLVEAITTATTCLVPDSLNADSPFANQKVREAVEYAINREAIAKTLGYGYWITAYQEPPPASSIFDPNFSLGRQYDVDKAKELLAETEYKDGFKMTLISAPAGRNKDVIAALQGYLSAIGITADVEYPDQPKFISYQTGTYQNAMLIQGFTLYPNMNSFLEQWLSVNCPRFKVWARSTEFNALVDKSSTSRTADTALMKACTDQLTKECALIPIHYSGRCWSTQSYVMDAGLFERGGAMWFNAERTWLNK